MISMSSRLQRERDRERGKGEGGREGRRGGLALTQRTILRTRDELGHHPWWIHKPTHLTGPCSLTTLDYCVSTVLRSNSKVSEGLLHGQQTLG